MPKDVKGHAVVTGGAGFIGSHLVDALLAAGSEVSVIDSLVSSVGEPIPAGVRFVRKDVADVTPADLAGADSVFHFAADPTVRTSATDPAGSFRNNVAGTFAVLEACRHAGVREFVFASSSVVYGRAKVVPTPEDAELLPISNYGASKAAGEAYALSFASTYGMNATIARMANIIGERSMHGVIYDFRRKLLANPRDLEILGDGKQAKSYLHVSDCVAGILSAWKAGGGIYNVGSRETRTVTEVAGIVAGEMGLSPEFRCTGGEVGWAGDIREMLLSTEKLEKLGWRPKVDFNSSVRRTVRWLGEKGK